MDIITIDFETYYDRDYSLSKLTTEAYIRDERFEVIGCAIKVNDSRTTWYESVDDITRELQSLNLSDKAILAHNTAFDGAILSWKYGIKPKLWLDTMSMARPYHNLTIGCSLNALTKHYKLGKKGSEVVQALGKRKKDFTPKELESYANYCINDVELTYKLWKKLSKGFPISEIEVIDTTLRMYTEPTIKIDKDLLSSHLITVKQNKQELLDMLVTKKLGSEDVQKILMSNQKFAKVLEHLGVDPPMKLSVRTGKYTYAFSKTDKQFLELKNHPNLMVQQIVSARLGVKSTIEETRTENLINVANRGTLPIMLNYYGAHTGRFSGGDKLNLQNLPRKGVLRKSITAPKGKVFIACDSSQIEARVVAYMSGQMDLLEMFKNGEDVYSRFASDIYGRKITKADKLERFVGKTCILGLGYGMGAEKFKNTLALRQGFMSVNIELDEAKRIVNLYRQKNHNIVSFWRTCGHALEVMSSGGSGIIRSGICEYDSNRIILPNKLYISYPELTRNSDGFIYISNSRTYRKLREGGLNESDWTNIYGGKVTENIVQALARIIISEQMIKISKHYKVLFQVHDELILITEPECTSHAREYVQTTMSTPPPWGKDLPLACESGVGTNYGETK